MICDVGFAMSDVGFDNDFKLMVKKKMSKLKTMKNLSSTPNDH